MIRWSLFPSQYHIFGVVGNNDYLISRPFWKNSPMGHGLNLSCKMLFLCMKYAYKSWLYFSLSFSPISSPSFSPLLLFTPFPTFLSSHTCLSHVTLPHLTVPFFSPLFLFNVSPILLSHIFSSLNFIPQIYLQDFSP